MVMIRLRSIVLLASGAVIALIAVAVFVGVRATAAPGPDETTFVPIATCRLFDTRPGLDNVGPVDDPVGPDTVHVQQVTGNNGDCAIPADATGVSLNVTMVNVTAPTFVTVFPADLAEPPVASNLNGLPGQPPAPNKVDVKLSPSGALGFYNLAGSVDLLADVAGYYTGSGLADLQSQIDAAKTKTVNFDFHGFQNVDFGTINGCQRDGSVTSAALPLPLPLGVTILGVTANVYDNANAGNDYLVALYAHRPRLDNTAYDTELLRVVSDGGAGGGIEVDAVDLTPDGEVVDENESFYVSFSSANLHGLCNVIVRYREP